jgi:hypothetical protein
VEGCSFELQMEKKGDGDLDEAILDDSSISCMSKGNKDKIQNEVAV